MTARPTRKIIVHHADGEQESIRSSLTPVADKVCNVILKLIVDASENAYFEQIWHLNIYEAMSAWKGFLYRSTNLISVENGKYEYVTILAFDNLDNCRAWITSDARKLYMDDAKAHNMLLYYINEFGGAPVDDPMNTANFAERNISEYNKISLQDMAVAAYVPRPPPKWKLCLIIWLGVYLAVLLGNFSGLGEKMLANRFPLYMVILLSLLHSVTVLSFTFFPLFMSIPPIAKWLKAPRPLPEDLGNLMWFLDQGFDLFSEELTTDIGELLCRVQKLEGRLDKLKLINFDLSEEVLALKAKKISGFRAEHDIEEGPENPPPKTIGDSVLSDPVRDSLEELNPKSRSHNKDPSVDIPSGNSPNRLLSRLKESHTALKRTFSKRDLNASKQVYISPSELDDITIKNSTNCSNMDETLDFSQHQHSALTLSVLNRVKWESTVAYEKWLTDMVKEMARYVRA